MKKLQPTLMMKMPIVFTAPFGGVTTMAFIHLFREQTGFHDTFSF
jgi:hypothetical protein